MSITYMKLRDGSWGLRATEEQVKQLRWAARNGTSVTVQTKAGKTKTEYPQRILWHNDEAAIATIRSSDRHQGQYRRRRDDDDDCCPSCGEVESWEVGCDDPWHQEHGV
jgi:hypothetical protein